MTIQYAHRFPSDAKESVDPLASATGTFRMLQDTLAGLRNIPYFAAITDEVLAKLADCAIKKNFAKGALIVNEGDEAGPLYIILSGKVRVFLCNENGKMVTLATQSAGSYFGELSLLDDEPRSASVITMEPTVCGLIPKNSFTNWLHEYPEEACLGIIRGLTRRIRLLTENVRGLALCDVYGRLIKTLEEMAQENEKGEKIIQEKISHQDLANLVGSSREMISKIMKDLQIGGYLSNEGKTIRLHRRLPSSW